ncbi:phosphoribosylamine--glycine ligase [Lentibacillus cibarius]|uniref:Phosphoribosylamine--glycine ligase n=1 Tax=Lentibacillus cibarius TaxID=2583219 RepID=A0A549YI66_9BACI|nr:phosphoribosylamine--glycine ligase [Lentibacillus cibarius]TRM11570.1 phosphoribosylamine--glycine ligase [Lentibacillus cibarius]
MNLLVVGSGGREHSLIMKLHESERVDQIYAAPGNGGISNLATCVNINEMDMERLVEFAREKEIDLTIVGPEAPLLAGIADRFHEAGLAIFAPSQKAALLEGSKRYAKDFMQKYDIPTADYASFTKATDAKAYINKIGAPVVVKADGLAAGKGVVVANTIEEAVTAVDELTGDEDGSPVIVVEECLVGSELSLMAFVHDGNVFPMLPARDYKRAYDDDEGPNTGGMGAYAPVADVSSETLEKVKENILQVTADGIKQEGHPFTGILYAGLMMTADGPKVIEFNARFGDPETQVVLPLLQNDLLQVFLDVLDGKDPELEWEAKSCAGVVLASAGYPGPYEKGAPLPELTTDENSFVVHAGTRETADGIVSDGGRVLLAGAKADTLPEAIQSAYDWLDQHIDSDAFFYRKDIARTATPSKLMN